MELYLKIKKTNKHLYIYVMDNGKALFSVTTDSVLFREAIHDIDKSLYTHFLAYILASRLMNQNLLNIRKPRTYRGTIAAIIENLKVNGIIVY